MLDMDSETMSLTPPDDAYTNISSLPKLSARVGLDPGQSKHRHSLLSSAAEEQKVPTLLVLLFDRSHARTRGLTNMGMIFTFDLTAEVSSTYREPRALLVPVKTWTMRRSLWC